MTLLAEKSDKFTTSFVIINLSHAKAVGQIGMTSSAVVMHRKHDSHTQHKFLKDLLIKYLHFSFFFSICRSIFFSPTFLEKASTYVQCFAIS